MNTLHRLDDPLLTAVTGRLRARPGLRQAFRAPAAVPAGREPTTREALAA
ncbi:hypothetical protein [Geodermatophilus ruber]|uniref:Uncharacterized protein n=1 Tax=Geodermatophilus ruber TaxID=504800 RepID=A0A1I4L6N3_9ACTN|nr:hypothetical protein [Geodermatophilus ruber]SFL86307.1 hypothetical protein SAMN04488085_12031 [Geodermatophilus ruber]